MRALFKNKETNRLKVGRITLVLFLVLLVAFSVVYKMSKTVNQVLVSIEHVFEPQATAEHEADTLPEEVKKALPEQTAKEKIKEPPPPKQLAEAPKAPEQLKEPEQARDSEQADPLLTQKTAVSVAKVPDLVPQEPIFNKALEKLAKTAPPAKPATVQLVSKKMKDLIKKADRVAPKEVEQGEPLTLPGKAYFDVYNEWQAAGDNLDKEKELVALRIVNLENVYDLFQMKVVAVKDNLPHIDLTDNSRVANPSLSEFSTTCFVVSQPWEKWGDALKTSGYKKNDDIQVRYYTYDFVRNAIYARAMKAFEWSLKQKHLPMDTDPGTADVLGVVYAVKKDSGGSFGVFVPTRVDFASHGSVSIDPLVCFSGQKDIEALNNAGLL